MLNTHDVQGWPISPSGDSSVVQQEVTKLLVEGMWDFFKSAPLTYSDHSVSVTGVWKPGLKALTYELHLQTDKGSNGQLLTHNLLFQSKKVTQKWSCSLDPNIFTRAHISAMVNTLPKKLIGHHSGKEQQPTNPPPKTSVTLHNRNQL